MWGCETVLVHTHCININAYIHLETPKKINFIFAFNAWGYQRIESNYLLYIYFCFTAMRSVVYETLSQRDTLTFKKIFTHSVSLLHPENSIRFHAFSGFPIKYGSLTCYHLYRNSNATAFFALSFFRLTFNVV